MNARVRRPSAGRTSARSSSSSTIAPQSSLPCTTALTMTWGPGRPLSKVCT